MNGAVLNLSEKKDIREMIVSAGRGSGDGLLREILTDCVPERITFICDDKARAERIRREAEGFIPDGVDVSFAGSAAWSADDAEKSGAILIDCPDDLEQVKNLVQLSPKYLSVRTVRGGVGAFDIWECFRKNAEHIYVSTEPDPKEGGRTEALDWERGDGDIELSVIFPMYNVSAYLRQCIESVTAWKADYVEFLFVDDGSPDDCADIVNECAANDSRIKLLRKQNGGCASARQFGMEAARGRYLGFVDPDDYVDTQMFRKLLGRAMTGSYEICWCGYNELYESTGEIAGVDDVLGEPYLSGTSDPHDINRLIAIRRIAIWRGIYLRSFLDREGIGFHTDLRRFDDLPFKVETMARARSVVCIPERLYYYRMSRPGQDVAADDERLYVHFDIFRYLDDFIVPGGSREQLGYLEVVKLHTHKWALEKMKDEFVKPYCERARRDLLANMTRREGRYYIHSLTTPRDRRFFDAICRGWVWMVRFLINRHK